MSIEALPAGKARRVGFRSTVGSVDAGPPKLVTANSPTNVSSEFRQRELHWVPSAPHRTVMHVSLRSRDERNEERT